MKILYGMEKIDVIQDNDVLLTIKSGQYYDEDETRVVLRCAEYVPEFQRGFMCGFRITSYIRDSYNGERENKRYVDEVQNLLLVYINKGFDIDSLPSFTYVFYK